MVADLENPDILSEAFSAIAPAAKPPIAAPLKIAVNVIPAKAKPTTP